MKQLCLFEPEQPHGGLQDAVTVKGEIAGGGMECKEMKRKEFFFFSSTTCVEFSLFPGDIRGFVYFFYFTCWAVYGGHYLTLIAAIAFVLHS